MQQANSYTLAQGRQGWVNNCQNAYSNCKEWADFERRQKRGLPNVEAIGEKPDDEQPAQQQQDREPAQSRNPAMEQAARQRAAREAAVRQQAAMEQAARDQATNEVSAESQATIQEIRRRQAALAQALAARKRKREGDASIGERQDNSDAQNNTSQSIRRNDDTRITSDGRINAASASDQLLTSSGLKCTEYVAKVVAMSGVEINQEIPNEEYTIKDAININQKVLPTVYFGDSRRRTRAEQSGDANNVLNDRVLNEGLYPADHTKGVVYALVAANKGKEIDIMGGGSIRDLQRGDFVQYWWLTKGGVRMGHAAVVVEPIGADGKVTLRGSQKGEEYTFRTTLSAADRKWAVRPNR